MGRHEGTEAFTATTAIPRTVAPRSTKWNLAELAKWQPQHIEREEFEPTLAANASNVRALVALYDAYNAAADALMAIENQPRSRDVRALLEDEQSRLMDCAFLCAAKLAAMPTVQDVDADCRAEALFRAAFRAGYEVHHATGVLEEALATPMIETPAPKVE